MLLLLKIAPGPPEALTVISFSDILPPPALTRPLKGQSDSAPAAASPLLQVLPLPLK